CVILKSFIASIHLPAQISRITSVSSALKLPEMRSAVSRTSSLVSGLPVMPAAMLETQAQKLSELVKDADYEPRYGIIGNKTVPRVLADFGYVETAYKILTRPTYPGFFNCLDRGATTIWGIWKGDTSLNHIMYGDVDAWFYKYLGGLNVSAGVVSLAPKAVENLSKFQMKYYDYCCSYEKIGNKLYYQIDVPKATQFTFACGKIIQLEKGVHNMEEDFKEFN
ncbi:MAG: hypothetical protein IJW31_10260, partial [Lentisphaeria bacterium]|nr:hypothetical protein [Lentisphaeria bacterium]